MDRQVVRFRAEFVSEARRADRSLADLLSVGDVVRVSATTANRRVPAGGGGGQEEEEVVLAQPATLTVSSPPSPAAVDAAGAAVVTGRGKLNVLTYRGGRVDSTAECVPCAYDYTARKRRVDVRVWQLSGIGYARLYYTQTDPRDALPHAQSTTALYAECEQQVTVVVGRRQRFTTSSVTKCCQ